MSFKPEDFTFKAAEAFQKAEGVARSYGHSEMLPIHVLKAIADEKDGVFREILIKSGALSDTLGQGIGRALDKIPKQSPPPDQVGFGKSMAQLLSKALEIKTKLGDSFISVDNLVMCLCHVKDTKELLSGIGLNVSVVEKVIEELRKGRTIRSTQSDQSFKEFKYGVNLVDQAIKGELDPVIGRDKEIRRIIRILLRRTKNNPILIGEPGVGKTAIVEGLARRIANEDVPESLLCSIYGLDLGLMLSGAKYRGEFEERVKDVLEQVKQSKGKTILFIDEIHLLVGAGKTEGAMDAANLFKPLLARGELRCIGATTLGEFSKYIEKDAALARRFQPVSVQSPNAKDTLSILRGLVEVFEICHGVNISDRALEKAVECSRDYITGRNSPDREIDLIDETCASLRMSRDTCPEEIDELRRRRLRLEIEVKALEKESDASSQQKLATVREELKKTIDELEPLLSQYNIERERILTIRRLKKRLDECRSKAEEAERRADIEQAADLRYGAIPELERQLREVEHSLMDVEGHTQRMVSETVTPEHVLTTVSEWTGIPVGELTPTAMANLIQLNEKLNERVIGQPQAVRAVSDCVVKNRTGLGKSEGPIGVFLFIGSSGVGKTELANAVALELFDKERSDNKVKSQLVRIDMSEFQEESSVAKLIGAPPGYVGHETHRGQLTEPVRQRPYRVILLDEIEKAAPNVLDLLLQLMEAGRLTDSHGNCVDFSNTLIMMTSNVLQTQIQEAATWSVSELYAQLATIFRPEFVNRFDDIVVFNTLNEDDVSRIVDLQMAQINQRIREKASLRLTLEISSRTRDWIVKEAYSPAFGARPIKRYIEKYIVNDLSHLLVQIANLDSVSLARVVSRDEDSFRRARCSKEGKFAFLME